MALRPVEEENEEVQRDCSVTLEHFCNEYFHSLKQKKAVMKDTVYYLPGMGGRLNTGLGKGIHDRGYKVVGRETRGEFQKYSFQDKIDLVANDLEQHFWYDEAKVVVNSFGAYLFFHAQLRISLE